MIMATHLIRANKQFRQGNYSKALALYDLALTENPSLAKSIAACKAIAAQRLKLEGKKSPPAANIGEEATDESSDFQFEIYKNHSAQLIADETFAGTLDGFDDKFIGGWYVDLANTEKSNKLILFANSRVIKIIEPNIKRQDLIERWDYPIAFHIETPLELLDGESYLIHIFDKSSKYLLNNCPFVFKSAVPGCTGQALSYLRDKQRKRSSEDNCEQLKIDHLDYEISDALDDILYKISQIDKAGAVSLIAKLIGNHFSNEPSAIHLTVALVGLIARTVNSEVSVSVRICDRLYFVFAQNKVIRDAEVIDGHCAKVPPLHVYSWLRRVTTASVLYEKHGDGYFCRIYATDDILEQTGFYWAIQNSVGFVSYTTDHPRPAVSYISDRIPKQTLAFNKKVSIIIPTFKRYDKLERLIESIYSEREFTIGPHQVIVADDSGDVGESPLEYIISSKTPPIKYIRNKENIGFLKNCNNAFKFATGDIVILANSDIELPAGWFTRILRPFLDPLVCLATPLATDGENLTLKIPEGFNWREVDENIAREPCAYPDACTAIGYFLAIRRTEIQGELFSTVYNHGYGEDSDLHFRIINQGLRSVVVPNLLVHHDHGSSYSTIPHLRDELRHNNHKIFMDSWGERYLSDLALFNINKISWFPSAESVSRVRSDLAKIDVLFITPSQHRRSGGVRVIYELAESLIRGGIKTAIALDYDGSRFNEDDSYCFKVFSSYKAVFAVKDSVGVVISTCFDTIPISETIARAYNAIHINLCQGPESLFSGGQYAGLYEHLIALPRKFVCVSDFLCQYLRKYFSVDRSVAINYGPNRYLYYDEGIYPRDNIVAIFLSKTVEKGSSFSILGAKKFFQLGYRVVAFGDDIGSIPDWIDFVGWQSDASLAMLFQRAKFYIESSYYEGLGLLALEAANCGAIPLIRYNGSGDVIFQKHDQRCFWSGPNDLAESIEYVCRLTDSEFEIVQRNVKEISAGYSLHEGGELFMKVISGLLWPGKDNEE